VIYAII